MSTEQQLAETLIQLKETQAELEMVYKANDGLNDYIELNLKTIRQLRELVEKLKSRVLTLQNNAEKPHLVSDGYHDTDEAKEAGKAG